VHSQAIRSHRQHGLEVDDEGLLKDLVVIFIFLKMLCIVRYFFNARVLFEKKKRWPKSARSIWLRLSRFDRSPDSISAELGQGWVRGFVLLK
jgi:hypothetical protein